MVLLYLVSSEQSSLQYAGLSLVSLQRGAEIACVEVGAEPDSRENKSILFYHTAPGWVNEFNSLEVNI